MFEGCELIGNAPILLASIVIVVIPSDVTINNSVARVTNLFLRSFLSGERMSWREGTSVLMWCKVFLVECFGGSGLKG